MDSLFKDIHSTNTLLERLLYFKLYFLKITFPKANN